jgi:hypothetical protein
MTLTMMSFEPSASRLAHLNRYWTTTKKPPPAAGMETHVQLAREQVIDDCGQC